MLSDLRGVLTHLRDSGSTKVATLGLSLGGHIAYLAAAKLPIQAAAVLYGGWPPTTDIPLSQPQPTLSLRPAAPLLYLVGEDDHVIPADHRRQIAAVLRAARGEHDVVEYPGVGHGFLNRRRPTYAPEAAPRRMVANRGLLSYALPMTGSAGAGGLALRLFHTPVAHL